MTTPRFVSRTRAAAIAMVALVAFVAGGTRVLTQSAAPKAPTVGKQTKVGPGLYELAVSESTGRVYVAAATSPASVHVLDAKTLTEVSKFDVSSAAAYGMALNDRTQTIYTTNTRAGNMSAIDVKTGKVIATIKDDATPNAHLFSVIVDEDTNTIYSVVAANPGKVWVIDGKSNTIRTIIDEVGQRTTGLALDKAGKKLYVSSQATNDVSVVDLTTNKVVGRLPSGGERPTKLSYDPKSGRLFVTNQGTAPEPGTLGIVDTKSGKLLHSVKTGAGALGVGYNPVNDLVYVANRQAGTVTVVNPSTGAIVTDLKAGTLPNTVAIDTKTGSVYVTNKARSAGRGAAGGRAGAPGSVAAGGAAGAGANAAAQAPAAPPADESGDTVTLIVR